MEGRQEDGKEGGSKEGGRESGRREERKVSNCKKTRINQEYLSIVCLPSYKQNICYISHSLTETDGFAIKLRNFYLAFSCILSYLY